MLTVLLKKNISQHPFLFDKYFLILVVLYIQIGYFK